MQRILIYGKAFFDIPACRIRLKARRQGRQLTTTESIYFLGMAKELEAV